MDNNKKNISYAFTYCFDISNSLNIDTNQFDLNFSEFAKHSCKLITRDDKLIKDTIEYKIVCSDFAYEEEAYDFSNKMIAAVKWFAFKIGTVVLPFIENDNMTINTEYFSEKLGMQIIPATNVSVYIQDKKPLFIRGSASLTMARNKEDELFRNFVTEYITDKSFAKFNLALNVYNESRRQKNLELKFLLLMIVLETLSEQKESNPKVVSFVDDVLNQLSEFEDIAEDDKKSLESRVQFLNKNSIRASIKTILKKYEIESVDYNNKTVDSFISYCYTLRSEFVHDGDIKLKKGHSFKKLLEQLDLIIKELMGKITLSNI